MRCMRVYLDVSCLNRPFDDQTQPRIRLEAEAVGLILKHVDLGKWRAVSSQMADIEIAAVPQVERRRRIRALLPGPRDRIVLSDAIFARAAVLCRMGFKPADAVHLAAAEAAKADVLLTCDDRFCRAARRNIRRLSVQVANPLDWLKEISDASNS